VRCSVFALVFVAAFVSVAQADPSDAIRDQQLTRLQAYVLESIQPSGLVRDALVLHPDAPHFHPATPDAAGFALLALCAFDHLGTLPDAEARVVDILEAHSGFKPGVWPERSKDGHFIHFMDLDTGAAAGGVWDASYSPISSALLVAGAQFASRHFGNNGKIAFLAEKLTDSVDFDAAIHPSLDGRIFLDMTKGGGGLGDFAVRPWNEYMLVESLALRQKQNARAQAVKHLWLDPDNLPTKSFAGTKTLTDHPAFYAPAFWVQQAHFFNGDFRHQPGFEAYFVNHRIADRTYADVFLGESDRYGFTAGVSPNGYQADAIFNHPDTVLSPEAAVAWGDLDALVAFHDTQIKKDDPRYRYGLVRVSLEQPTWMPYDTGMVDHLFLLFGLVESMHPTFFAERVFPALPSFQPFRGKQYSRAPAYARPSFRKASSPRYRQGGRR
jgi:hypothetical protein